MIIPAYYEATPSYKDYKNRTVTKHLDKAKNQLSQIKQCSLKQEDKVKPYQQIIEIFTQK